MRLLFMMLMLCHYGVTQAQVKQTLYFNSTGEVTAKRNAHIYSVITRNEKDTAVYAVETFSAYSRTDTTVSAAEALSNRSGLVASGTYRGRNYPVKWESMHLPTFRDARKDGLFREYYENGQLKFEGAYRDGRGEGRHRRWYGNGNLLSDAIQVEGRTEGSATTFYENGKIKTRYTAKQGLIEGEMVEFHDNGMIKAKDTFRKSVRVGERVWCDEKGEEIKKGNGGG